MILGFSSDSDFAKVMDVNPTKHLVFFLCIDYTIWPGGKHNHNIFLLTTLFGQTVFVKLFPQKCQSLQQDGTTEVSTFSPALQSSR